MLDFEPLPFPTSISIRSKEGSMFWDKPKAEVACVNSQSTPRLTSEPRGKGVGWGGPNTGLLTLGTFMSYGKRRVESNPGWGGQSLLQVS